MTNIRIKLLEKFEQHVERHFEQYCEEQHVEKESRKLLNFLIDHDLLLKAQIERYTIIHEFEEVYKEEQQHKTQAVAKLAVKFNLSERSIWTILKYVSQNSKTRLKSK